ncbi:MAG TPA: hypothetical protein VKF81_04915 [Blastocatellia bacterium]|nr:hypothetical protein [Blastocatellia bacterium]
MPKLNSDTVSIGLRAKTGRAIAVVLTGSSDSPRVMKRTQLTLTDPRTPATSQPYHEVMDLPWEQAQVAVRKTAKLIEKAASKSLRRLVQEMQSEGLKVRGVGIVGAGNRNLEKIGSTHIRAHAAEGVLFRQVLETAAELNGLRSRTFDERSVEEIVASEMGLSAEELRRALAEMGRAAGPPWRADEKSAAMAAWPALPASAR